MTTPRPHAEMSALYMSNSTLKCWYWHDHNWVEVLVPSWATSTVYFLGHEAPTEPPRKICTLGGLTFPAPETIAPGKGRDCWLVFTDSAARVTWYSSDLYERLLKSGYVHLTEEAAQAHSKALIAANRLAVEGAV